ncbi:porin family protein [Aureispira anguillae]|uniref:PorT family protein n=1 Tax=Aureispira anguillae TaxID=2864201 RepID=A0A915VKF9_9BACT|nr:porin family protein [Aureispira anguillae]BDS09681.1 PorT family protein [Aureispira anguillae]
MKNLTFLALALFMTSNIFAQKGLEITVGFTPGLSFMLNDEDLAEGQALNIQPTFGFQTGLTVGYNFSERIGLATGIGYAALGQNYTTDYDGWAKDDQIKYDRKTSYIRVPVLLRVGGDPTASTSAFLRFGPHFDFLSSAIGRNYGSKNNPTDVSRNYRDVSKLLSSDKAEIYKSFVLGLTLEVGGKIRINDQMGVLVLFHLETSLTNPEGEDAAYTIYSGFPSSGTLTSPERAGTWSLMAGLNIGFQYALNFGN